MGVELSEMYWMNDYLKSGHVPALLIFAVSLKHEALNIDWVRFALKFVQNHFIFVSISA